MHNVDILKYCDGIARIFDPMRIKKVMTISWFIGLVNGDRLLLVLIRL